MIRREHAFSKSILVLLLKVCREDFADYAWYAERYKDLAHIVLIMLIMLNDLAHTVLIMLIKLIMLGIMRGTRILHRYKIVPGIFQFQVVCSKATISSGGGAGLNIMLLHT